MEEMEQERLAREYEEQERVDRLRKIKEQFNDPNSEWEKDKTEMQNIAMQDKAKEGQAEAKGPDVPDPAVGGAPPEVPPTTTITVSCTDIPIRLLS
jgi:mannan polymerase II complex ANP1 subunit